jgi:hypothetical protein
MRTANDGADRRPAAAGVTAAGEWDDLLSQLDDPRLVRVLQAARQERLAALGRG